VTGFPGETVIDDAPIAGHLKLIEALTEEYQATTDPEVREGIEERCLGLAFAAIRIGIAKTIELPEGIDQYAN